MPDRTTVALVAFGLGLLVVPSLVSAVTAPSLDRHRTDDGDLYVSYEGTPDGRVSRYNPNYTEIWTHRSARSYLQVQDLSGNRVFFTWKRIHRTDCGPFPAQCARTGFTIYDRANDTVLRRWSYPVRTGANSEIHDAEVLDDGRVLVAGMDRERVFILDRSGTVTWQWNASNFYEPPPDPTRRDWLHINDVDRIGDGRYLVSVRNANQLLILQRGRGVVDVVNAEREGYDAPCTKNGDLYDRNGDGDVRCGDPSVLNGQHNPHWLGNGTVLVADSLNDRVVELQRQPDGEWQPIWVVNSVGGVPLDWPRDADRLPNGNTLITDSLNDRVVEVAPNGTLVWSMDAPGLPYEADQLPYGEVNVSTLAGENESTVAADGASRIPLVSRARNGLMHVLPVPFWFSDLHMLAAMVGLLATLIGGLRGAKGYVTAGSDAPDGDERAVR